MDVSEYESRKGGEMEIHHFSHQQHPLVFISDQSFASEVHSFTKNIKCSGCDKKFEEGESRYGCEDCKYYLHKVCGELEFSPQIHHPFHPQHLLTLFPKPPYVGSRYRCNFCCSSSRGFVYHCDPCQFNLHVNCALLQSSIAANVPNFFHDHPLFFLPNHNDQVKSYCSGCKKPLYGPIYHCPDCSNKSNFNLHKGCAELPFQIYHPYDRNHPLTLSSKPPSHTQRCRCYLCKIQWSGFVYSCSLCNFEFSLEDISALRTITIPSHLHPWTLLPRQMSFSCDFCGAAGDRNPYLCATCGLLVHQSCIWMPHMIMTTRHEHNIYHSYSLPQNQVEDWICKICYEEVDKRYGCYYCAHSNCKYIAHVHCATDKTIWDGTIIPEADSSNLITCVFEELSFGDQMVAIEITHAYHDHNLRLIFNDEIKDDDSQCDGCMMRISTDFYTCDQCNFFLHKDCAELPREKRHPFHKHLLTLTNSHKEEGYSTCGACQRDYHGFSYKCNNEDCESHFKCDIRCILLSDTLTHPSHEHSLFLFLKPPKRRYGLFGIRNPDKIKYSCMEHCGFSLNIKRATEPLIARYKYDSHPLHLTFLDDSSPSQHYCDLCENERDPNEWFYYCADCDNSLHFKCALGDPQFMKLGSKVKFYFHQHPLTVVKNIWNCPPCKICSNLCIGPALECKDPECNFTIHYHCRLR